jgi:hypothetical protein
MTFVDGLPESAFSVANLNKPLVRLGLWGKGRIGDSPVRGLGQTPEGSGDIKCSVQAPGP